MKKSTKKQLKIKSTIGAKARKEGENVLTKYDLRKCRNLKKVMLDLQDRITELESMMTAPRIPQLTGMPGGSHSEHDKIGNAVAKADKLRNLYYDKWNLLMDLQFNIEKEIAQLPADDQMLLRLYYFSCYTWVEVAARMGYEWAQIHRKHRAILERLAQNGAEEKNEKA